MSKEESRQRLVGIFPHLKLALAGASVLNAQDGNSGGKGMLAVVHKNEDGSGRIGATFQADEFMEDLLAVLDDEELSFMFNRSKDEG
jgi:hypothetical protein